MRKIIKYIKKYRGIKIPKKTYYQEKKEIGSNTTIIRFKYKR